MQDIVPAEYSQTPPTATYFHYRFPRGDPKRRTQPISMVAIDSARLEQRRGMLTFDEIMKFVVYYTANFPH